LSDDRQQTCSAYASPAASVYASSLDRDEADPNPADWGGELRDESTILSNGSHNEIHYVNILVCITPSLLPRLCQAQFRGRIMLQIGAELLPLSTCSEGVPSASLTHMTLMLWNDSDDV
jgi:hypothetical protein